jgi:WhiB family redox-sensing transcriptional regulator
MATLDEDPPWQEYAYCRSMNPVVFFPEPVNVPGQRKGATSDKQIEAEEYAQSICLFCSVKSQCRDYADAHRIEDGVWGGETSAERAKRWKARRRLKLM